MKEFLTESEAALSRTTTNKTNNLPPVVAEYARYLEKTKSFGAILNCIKVIELFYKIVSRTFGIEVTKIAVEDLLSVDRDILAEVINTEVKPRKANSEMRPPSHSEMLFRRNSLFDYYKYLCDFHGLNTCMMDQFNNINV